MSPTVGQKISKSRFFGLTKNRNKKYFFRLVYEQKTKPGPTTS